MTPPLDVIEVVLLVRKLGCELREVQYTAKAFGSWYITVQGSKGITRVVWDGKDGVLILQLTSDRDRSDWRDIWIGREAAEQTLETLELQLPR